MIKYTILFAISLLLVACGTKKNTNSIMPLAPDILTGTVSKWVVDAETKDSTESTINYAFYTNPTIAWQDSVNQFIVKETFVNTSVSEDVIFKRTLPTHAYFYNALHDLLKVLTSQDTPVASYVYLNQINTIDNSEKMFCQVQVSTDTYYGGAHPNSWEHNAIFSKVTNGRVYLRDLFTDESKLHQLGEINFRKAMKLKPSDDLTVEGFWFENGVFKCPENFRIEKDGIHFVFNAYDVAPYVMGRIDFVIPMAQLNAILVEPFEFTKK